MALELKNNSIHPKEGISISDAKKIITDYLRAKGTQGDIESVAKIEEITANEIWNDNKIQLFKVEVDYAWLYGVAIIKDKTVLKVLPGMPTESVFVSDLDNDKIYEIYSNVYFGSGIISKEIRGFNPKTNEEYSLSGRFKGVNNDTINYTLFIKDNKLFAKTDKTSGILALAVKDGKKLLELK